MRLVLAALTGVSCAKGHYITDLNPTKFFPAAPPAPDNGANAILAPLLLLLPLAVDVACGAGKVAMASS